MFDAKYNIIPITEAYELDQSLLASEPFTSVPRGASTLDNGGFQFCQTGLIRKVLEFTGMEDCNGLRTPTKVEAPLGIDVNGSEDDRDWLNSYDSVIGMMLYLASNTIPDISFAVHKCARFTHNTKASHETAVKRICWYL